MQCAPTCAALACSCSSRITSSTARPQAGAAVQPPAAGRAKHQAFVTNSSCMGSLPVQTRHSKHRLISVHLSAPCINSQPPGNQAHQLHFKRSPKVAKNSIPFEKAAAKRPLVTSPAMGNPLPHGLPAR